MSSGNKTICIIGGGVAGLLAAVTAADEGASVKLFEKMSKVGLKMGITGKGRCNLTNSAPNHGLHCKDTRKRQVPVQRL